MRGTDDTDVARRDELPLTGRRMQPRLRWVDAEGTHEVDVRDRALLGSSEGVAIRICERTVSRVHAEIETRSDGVWIRDLGSRNGTMVQGILVERARLPDHGSIRLGNAELTLLVDGQVARVPLWPDARFGPLIGRSEPMRELFMQLAQYAQSNAPVLVQGPTGTGKELVARAIHEASDRADAPLVVVDCGALPENLLEGELFGHARGAFTGAMHARAGAIESADGGTLFLDEIGELPLWMQPRLLRAIETKTVRRLGETSYRNVDIRVIAATHRDLASMVATGTFREDLYFRLAVLPAVVPPLAARAADIPVLLDHFLTSRNVPPLPQDLLGALALLPWAGNVRELRTFAERVAVMGTASAWATLRGTGGLPSGQEEATPRAGTSFVLPDVPIDLPFKDLRERVVDQLEREYVKKLLAAHGRNVTAVAEAAGLDRSYVHRLLRKHDL